MSGYCQECGNQQCICDEIKGYHAVKKSVYDIILNGDDPKLRDLYFYDPLFRESVDRLCVSGDAPGVMVDILEEAASYRQKYMGLLNEAVIKISD